MTAMNVVHMRVKPGMEQNFLDIHRDFVAARMKGGRHFRVVKTGDRDFCIVGEWDSFADLAAARPAMIGNLDRLRSLLEERSDGKGVTDPYSGEVVLEFNG